MNVEIRKAVAEDSPILAKLMNIAGDGIPAYLWSKSVAPGEDAMEFGARRVARAEGDFSFSNTHIAVVSGVSAGMLLSYRLSEAPEDEQLDECPAVVRPLVELEALLPGAWYINAVATVLQFRGLGVGSRLIAFAESLAAESPAEIITLIVAEENNRARTLYEKLGYQLVARRPIVPFAGCPHGGDYILMKKPLGIQDLT